MMKLLIDRGADIQAGAPGGPPLFGEGKTRGERGRTAVHVAAERGNIEAPEFLLGRGGNPNNADVMGTTPLFTACTVTGSPATRVAVAQILLDAGADAACASPCKMGPGRTALLMSTLLNDVGMIDLLATRAPATLDMCYLDGNSPLALAAREGHEAAVTPLLKAGARYKPGSYSGERIVPADAAYSQGGEG